MTPACAAIVVVAAAGAACHRRAPIASCDDDLHGVYVTPAGERWMVLDNGPTLEVYPLFDDSVPDGAPRLIDLRRDAGLAGHVKRRYMRRAEACEARAPVRITACTRDALEIELADVVPPLSFTPCAWGQPAPARVETWSRR